MNKKNKEDKKSFIQLFLSQVREDSSGKDSAEEVLRSDDVNVERLKWEGLALIKKKQLEIQARQTEREMGGMDIAARQAEKWVDQLLRSATFSFTEIVHEEEMVIAFSNITELSPDAIRAILIQHFTLKFMQKKP
jgi:hypothetical protein